MPRRLRDSAPGIQHVWVNATGGEDYYRDDVDRVTWLRLLVKTCDRHAWRCVAVVQMTTHVHLILEVPDHSLAHGMQWLNSEYSRHFNDRHGRRGQFVRGRYGSRRISSGRDLVTTYAYVVLNPVNAGLRPRAEDWRWSSYATALGLSTDFPFVDASRVAGEAGGTPDDLRGVVEAKSMERLSGRDTSGL
jgi:putative transposase